MEFKKKLDKFLSNYEFGDSNSIELDVLGRTFMNSGSSINSLIECLTKIIGDKPTEKINYDTIEEFLCRFHDFMSEKIDFDIKNNIHKINPTKKKIELYDTIILTNKNTQHFAVCWSIVGENKYLLYFFRESFIQNTLDFGNIKKYIYIPTIIPYWD